MRTPLTRFIAAIAAVGLLMALIPSVFAAGSPAGGRTLWTSRYDGPAGGGDGPADVGVSPDGSKVFVTGLSFGGGAASDDFATASYDASTGDELWTSRYDTGHLETAVALAVSPVGSAVFVTGFIEDPRYAGNYTTVAYDSATGSQLWAVEYDGVGFYDTALDVAVSPDGSSVFVTGYSEGDRTCTDYATLAYDATTGEQQWVARYDGPFHCYDVGQSVLSTPDGSMVLVTGTSAAPQTADDYLTLAYDAESGVALWVARYDGPGDGISADYARDIEMSSDGAMVFVTGYSQSTTSNYDYATVAYDTSTGGQLWVARYDGPANEQDNAEVLGVSPDDSAVFVTGVSDGGLSDYDYATVAYDATNGSELWVSRYGGKWYDSPSDLGVDPSGSAVYVTGSRRFKMERIEDFVTLAYDPATGHRLWSSRNGGPESDNPAALAVSPDGEAIFVTGVLYRADGTTDWGTLALAT